VAEEAANPNSLINRRGTGMREEFDSIFNGVQRSLKQLEMMVVKYRSLGAMKRNKWDKLRFCSKDLSTIRQKLAFHMAHIDLFMNSLTVGSLARIEVLLEDFINEVRSGKRTHRYFPSSEEAMKLLPDGESWKLSWLQEEFL
jgi:hypothetical protein